MSNKNEIKKMGFTAVFSGGFWTLKRTDVELVVRARRLTIAINAAVQTDLIGAR